MITVSGVSKSYGATRALENVSFALRAGEVAGLLGRNGAGKTTTLRVITGYAAPSEGSVTVAGFDVMEQPLEVKARIGYSPERPPVYPEMLVTTYLRFCARLRGVPRRETEARIDEVLARCGLEAVAGRIIGNLSRGFQQRVGLAQALVHDPNVLVLDEPTSALDPGQIHELRQFVKGLVHQEGRERTIILSTHRLEDVLATCDRVLVIHAGRLVADESLADATRHGSLEERFLALTSSPAPGGE